MEIWIANKKVKISPYKKIKNEVRIFQLFSLYNQKKVKK